MIWAEERSLVLSTALRVIDHVYSNMPLDGRLPSNPHEWDIQEARDAMSGIIIYCENPVELLDAFRRAIGLHNPEISKAPLIDVGALDEFRVLVRRELGTPGKYVGDLDFTWISGLAGGKIGRSLMWSGTLHRTRRRKLENQ